MFARSHYPLSISPEQLDSYLESGWYRMGQSVFTSAYIEISNIVHRSIWLRVKLGELQNDPGFKKLMKLNSGFTVSIQPASISPEKEALFQLYKTGISFQTYDSLENLLYRGADYNIFNTMEINLYDEDRLIAVGYFDVGNNGAAGISSFYLPVYKKHSLGKFLIYQKMLYCQNNHIKYYYLGYIAPGNKRLDYKLDIAKGQLEFYDLPTGEWKHINTYESVKGSIEETRQKLFSLHELLGKENIETRFYKYLYHQINLYTGFEDAELFDHIMFLYCFPTNPDIIFPLLIVYDFRHNQYQLIECMSIGQSQEQTEDPDIFSSDLLQTKEILFSSESAQKMVDFIKTNVADKLKDQSPFV
ncbi:MAG: arginyl-tRNA--protein arginylyltransferase [Cytophagaceae bacterium]